MSSYENRVYQIWLDEGPPVVAKFYRPGRWSEAQILEEHAFAAELDRAEIPVVAPMELDGATLRHAEGFRLAVFPRRGGRAPELDDGTLSIFTTMVDHAGWTLAWGTGLELYRRFHPTWAWSMHTRMTLSVTATLLILGTVFVANEPARAFYAARGLLERERTDGSANEERAPDIRMQWAGD